MKLLVAKAGKDEYNFYSKWEFVDPIHTLRQGLSHYSNSMVHLRHVEPV